MWSLNSRRGEEEENKLLFTVCEIVIADIADKILQSLTLDKRVNCLKLDNEAKITNKADVLHAFHVT